ncbi:MAG: LysR family transcriptional regulator [Pseudomonadota bacterium]
MDHRQLEALYWIGRLGSFAAAARKLNTSQPAISLRIRDLERSLGVALFDRSRRRAVLTPQGREAAAGAERLLSFATELQERLAKPGVLSGLVRVGVTETIALTWLPKLVQRINGELPDVILELDVDLMLNLWEKFERGNLELLLLPGPIDKPDLVMEYLGGTPYVWMSAPRPGLPNRPITPADLQTMPIITLGSASTMHGVSERWFKDHGTQPRSRDICNSLAVVANLTTAGLGVSLLPPIIYHRELERGQLIVLESEPALPPIEFWAVYPRRPVSPLPAAVTRFAKLISTFERGPASAAGQPA